METTIDSQERELKGYYNCIRVSLPHLRNNNRLPRKGIERITNLQAQILVIETETTIDSQERELKEIYDAYGERYHHSTIRNNNRLPRKGIESL